MITNTYGINCATFQLRGSQCTKYDAGTEETRVAGDKQQDGKTDDKQNSGAEQQAKCGQKLQASESKKTRSVQRKQRKRDTQVKPGKGRA